MPRRSSLLWLALAAVSLGCVARPLATEVPIALSPVSMSGSEWRVVDNVIIVTDASGTTYVNETFPRSKALTRSFVAALPETSERAKDPSNYAAATISFGGDDRVTHPLTDFDRASLSSTVERVDVMGAIDGRGGLTPLDEVFEEIGQALDGRSGAAAVILFSDGNPDDEGDAFDAAQALIAGHSDGVCIHTVQVGASAEGERFMRTLSELSSPCGSYRSAHALGSSDQLAGFAHAVMAGNAPTPRTTPAVAANACDAAVRLQGVEFDTDRATIRAANAAQLDSAAQQIRECPALRIVVGGYTDSRGPEAYNQTLSQRRAAAVVDYLVKQGVDASRLSSEGFGENKPIGANDSREGRQRNRRAELIRQD